MTPATQRLFELGASGQLPAQVNEASRLLEEQGRRMQQSPGDSAVSSVPQAPPVATQDEAEDSITPREQSASVAADARKVAAAFHQRMRREASFLLTLFAAATYLFWSGGGALLAVGAGVVAVVLALPNREYNKLVGRFIPMMALSAAGAEAAQQHPTYYQPLWVVGSAADAARMGEEAGVAEGGG